MKYNPKLTTEWIIIPFEELGADPLGDDHVGELGIIQPSFFEALLDLMNLQLLHVWNLSVSHPISMKEKLLKRGNIPRCIT